MKLFGDRLIKITQRITKRKTLCYFFNINSEVTGKSDIIKDEK